jgi:hypothetical protein
MRGWHIFTHSAGLVFRNFDAALRLSLVPYSVQILAQLYAFLNPDLVAMSTELGGDLPQVTPAQVAIFLMLQFASLGASLWIAVSWHRFVLMEDIARGWVPFFRGDLMLGYLGRSILLALLMAVAVLIVSIPAGLMMSAIPGATIALLMGVAVIAMYVFLRLGVILPAGAVGVKVTLQQAWAATKAEQGAILALCFIIAGCTVVLQIPLLLAGGGGSAFSVVYGLVFGWVATMVGSSLLTSLYGICVEGRSID